MKFAVVEYNSKSGKVWRHTKKRPNYLADPTTEIDPTSFGCYVSALEGEHIPLKGLIVGPVNDVSLPVQLYRKAVKRLRGAWPSYDISYLEQYDVLLVVHQLSDAHEMVALAQRLQKPYVIGVPTQPWGQLKTVVERDARARQHLIEFIQACDTFISVVRSTVPWYENIAQRKVTYLEQPYPVDYATTFALPPNDKDKLIVVAGVTQRDNIRQGQIVARELQKKFPDYAILIPKVAAYDYNTTDLGDARYTFLPFEQWQDHLKTLAKTMLVINTDYTQTRGRVQTDCAAVGTPSLGGNSDGQVDLFPQLASTPTTNTADLIKLGERLLNDPIFYIEVVQTAAQKLQKYNYTQSAARLRALVPPLF